LKFCFVSFAEQKASLQSFANETKKFAFASFCKKCKFAKLTKFWVRFAKCKFSKFVKIELYFAKRTKTNMICSICQTKFKFAKLAKFWVRFAKCKFSKFVKIELYFAE
jgi:phosphorylcholine metabolism protein LicD